MLAIETICEVVDRDRHPEMLPARSPVVTGGGAVDRIRAECEQILRDQKPRIRQQGRDASHFTLGSYRITRPPAIGAIARAKAPPDLPWGDVVLRRPRER